MERGPETADKRLESQALDRDFGVPLVREGVAGLDDAVNTTPYQFADPANVLTPNAAQADYGWMSSTGTQRVLFPRPKITRGAKAITSDLAPLLADSFAMGAAVGIFPRELSCLEVPSPSYSLQMRGTRIAPHLAISCLSASLIGGGNTRELGKSASTRFFLDYTKTVINLMAGSWPRPLGRSSRPA